MNSKALRRRLLQDLFVRENMAKPNDGKRISLKMFENEFRISTTTATACILASMFTRKGFEIIRASDRAKVNIIKHWHTHK